ncbi:MAG: MmgE/PrpD family protein [Phycisphaerales bacterium]|nr:MmgE/PrpD family protein [Phycisphaerales bacterium]
MPAAAPDAPVTTTATQVTLPRGSNQALGIGRFAIDFMSGTLGPGPAAEVLRKTELFHTDSVFCGISALALNTNAPRLLRAEALEYQASAEGDGAAVFGSSKRVKAEKAVVANSAAVREWDSNGTNFGFNPGLGHTAGEFGHNDFYPVVMAACQQRGLDGKAALRGMALLDEIRGRLAEVFSLKTYKIDHVVHGAIASAATYGAIMGATAEQIEHAIGMVVAHYIPWRAIRAGKQLSDSKGASAAISSEVAVLSMKRAMRGFIGPKDIFRNPESMFRQFVKTGGESPFDLVLSHSGADFAVMGMHFKLGLYEHQSAGALQGLIDLLNKAPELIRERGGEGVRSISITAYEPAFGIIGDPAKRDPRTRQSADHSMVYIVATLLRKALQKGLIRAGTTGTSIINPKQRTDETWKALMLAPHDYGPEAIVDPLTRSLMERISFVHGGPEYDRRYPDGIPTSVQITDSTGKVHDSGLVMYPAGHARNTTADLTGILQHKFEMLGTLAVKDPSAALRQLSNLGAKSAAEIAGLYNFEIVDRGRFE